MEIAQIGEFGLIERITKDIEINNPSTIKGVGDDCAVINNGEQSTLITTDMLMEGVHFDLTYVDLFSLGYKAAMVNISDIFAMNASPKQLIISLAVDKRFIVEDVEAFYRGLKEACKKWKIDIVGGDTTSSRTGIAISITCIGEANPEEIVFRNGAKNNDLICVSGDLGAAYMGLKLLEREKTVYYQQLSEAKRKGKNNSNENIEQFQPDFAGKEYLLQRQLRCEARGDIIQRLKEAGLKPNAMIDISDGLSSELIHICRQSQKGCKIFEKNLPIDYQTAVMAEELNLNVTTCAMNGGEDYELLFTIPIGDYETVKTLDDIHIIGHITEDNLRPVLITRDGNEIQITAQGWDALLSSPKDPIP